jgi:hypothetical protein
MFSKEELLEKGISEEVADEIIAAASDEGSENSLQALEKAISTPEEGELFKAKGGKGKGEEEAEEEEEGEDYDESYMRKYMKRYMKENKKACGKMAKEVGIFSGNMEKATELDMDAEGAIVEMADLKPILEEQGEFNSRMAKAIETLAEQVMYISERQDKSFDLMTKAAAVQVETAKGLGEFLSTPAGRKGVTASVEMQKASQVASSNTSKEIYSKLMKAVQSGNRDAGVVISAFEVAGKRVERLNPAHQAFITQLMQEGK